VADVLDPAAIGTALAGADAVISVLGPRSYRTASSIISAGTASILAAMGAAGTSRLVVVSAAPVASDDHGTTVAYRLLVGPLLRALLRRGYADMTVMEEAVRRSGVDWTILRPPRLTDGPRAGTWRQATDANLRGGYRIARADVAAAILASLDDPDTVKATIAIGYWTRARPAGQPPLHAAVHQGNPSGRRRPCRCELIGGAVMRVFVLGGTGAIGGHVIPTLVGQGHTVTALARTPAKAAVLTAQGATAVSVSIFDRSALATALVQLRVSF
jgi:putative NADH-flavin reductase